jgi:hypothetical protein
LAVRDDATERAVRVALSGDTEIRCSAGPACRCRDLRLRQRVRIEGRQPPAGGVVTAASISVIGRPG